MVFTWVPKCGSTTLVSLLRLLAKRTNIHPASARFYIQNSLDQEEELELVRLLKREGDAGGLRQTLPTYRMGEACIHVTPPCTVSYHGPHVK